MYHIKCVISSVKHSCLSYQSCINKNRIWNKAVTQKIITLSLDVCFSVYIVHQNICIRYFFQVLFQAGLYPLSYSWGILFLMILVPTLPPMFLVHHHQRQQLFRKSLLWVILAVVLVILMYLEHLNCVIQCRSLCCRLASSVCWNWSK